MILNQSQPEPILLLDAVASRLPGMSISAANSQKSVPKTAIPDAAGEGVTSLLATAVSLFTFKRARVGALLGLKSVHSGVDLIDRLEKDCQLRPCRACEGEPNSPLICSCTYPKDGDMRNRGGIKSPALHGGVRRSGCGIRQPISAAGYGHITANGLQEFWNHDQLQLRKINIRAICR